MKRCLWLAVLLGLTTALPVISQEELSIGDAIAAAMAGRRSVVDAEAAARAAALSLRLAEIDHDGVAVTLSATPSASVDLADTFDVDGSGTVSAAVALPWGMEITGSYTAEVDLDGTERDAENVLDLHSLSVSQDLLPEGRLSTTALAVADRQDQLRLARLRLLRVANEVVLQVARSFLALTERTAALELAEQRFALAERDLAHTRTLVAQQAAGHLDLLDAKIAVTEQRLSLDEARAAVTLDTNRFLADLGLPPTPLTVPTADFATLRQRARALLADPTPPVAIATALEVLEAEAALSSAERRAERAERGLLPELALSLDYRKPRSAPRPGSLSLSITGRYTLFDGERSAVAAAQAQEQVATAVRTLATARTEVEDAFERARIALANALAAEELAALRLERAQLALEQATRHHDAGAISDRELDESALLLRDAEGAANAAALALGDAYLSVAIELGLDLERELAAIAR